MTAEIHKDQPAKIWVSRHFLLMLFPEPVLLQGFLEED